MARTIFRALALVVAALIATPAAAADLYYGKAPAFAAAPFNGYNWNGAYVGVNLGYQWGKMTNWGGGEANGVMGGGQIGYNWQFGQYVFGLEADIAAADLKASDTDPITGIIAEDKVRSFGSATGRLPRGAGAPEADGIRDSPRRSAAK